MTNKGQRDKEADFTPSSVMSGRGPTVLTAAVILLFTAARTFAVANEGTGTVCRLMPATSKATKEEEYLTSRSTVPTSTGDLQPHISASTGSFEDCLSVCLLSVDRCRSFTFRSNGDGTGNCTAALGSGGGPPDAAWFQSYLTEDSTIDWIQENETPPVR